VPWASTVALSDYGFDYLSMVWRSSSLRVVVTATDIATSRRTVRTKTFRLRLR
jgi:ABC-type arginine/histidine transport system permease subunit